MGLTKYPSGSLRELWKIAFPLMLSSLSVMAMIFVDRILLAYYSPGALNAAVSATTLGWAFVYGWMVMCSIAEVFVAQYNGSGEHKKLGEPVWQMIWLSGASFLFFVPFAIWGVEWVYGTGSEYAMERSYLRWMMLFGPSYPFYAALCGFFIGQGKTNLITSLAVVANVVNAICDYVLIFGIDGILDPMGVKGAAIATSASSVFQVAILFMIFIKKKNREQFGTGVYALSSTPFLQCFRIGFPGAIFVAIEILGWAAYYAMMAYISERHITIVGIAQSIVILLFFFAEGVSKAASTIAGNLIGAKQEFLIDKMVKAGFKIHFTFFVLLTLLFTFYSDWLTAQFLTKADPELIPSMQETLRICVFFTIVYLLFEGLRMLISGVLTAAGDTVFLLVAGSLSVWLFLVVPNYFLIVQEKFPVEVGSFVCLCYAVAAFGIYLWRFKQGKWKEIKLAASTSNEANAFIGDISPIPIRDNDL